MGTLLSTLRADGVVLLAVAAPKEMDAVLAGLGVSMLVPPAPWQVHAVRPRVHVMLTGVGKVNAAGAVAARLDPARHAAVLSVGIAGALDSSLPIGTALAAQACIYADEGLGTPEGFVSCAAMGFPALAGLSSNDIPVDGAIQRALAPFARLERIATVSTCSGTDALRDQVRQRTGAAAEAMEGAAVAHVALRLGVPAGELRVISNTTGDRPRQQWNLPAAFAALAQVLGRVFPDVP
jgi:futalosine hydrolase